jgi:hypothetical protein
LASWGSDNGGGDRARAHIARTSQTFSAVPVWTPSEDDFIRLHYPNYRTLRAGFPHRAISGIRQRALDCRFTLVDLDEVARTKSYFRHTTRRVTWRPATCSWGLGQRRAERLKQFLRVLDLRQKLWIAS